jgi:hypothetical protein
MPARDIFSEAVRILADKARSVLGAMEGGEGGDADLPLLPAHRAAKLKDSAMRSAVDEDDMA